MTKTYIGKSGKIVTKTQAIVEWTGRTLFKSMIVSGVISISGWLLLGGYYYAKSNIAPVTVYAEKITEVPITTWPPILTRICRAESGLHQFKANGDVIRGRIEPSDIGYCQINETIWNDKARKLGFDIFTEQGNKDMAMYLFNNYGTEPWNSSRSIWSK